MNRLTAAIVLPMRFTWALAASGLQTVGVILRYGLRRRTALAGFVRIGFAPMSASGAALLGCLISLTPGTTVVDIDMSSHEMVLHMLDVRTAESEVDAIRRDFEPGVVAWFGERA